MAEETVTITAPTTQTVISETTPIVTAPVEVPIEQDLISKVAEFKKSKIVKQNTDNQPSFFDYKEIEKISDPTARKFAEDAYKSMQSGFTKKTQEIAEQKKQFDQKMQEMKNWTPDRIQRELLSDPQFLQAAQQ